MTASEKRLLNEAIAYADSLQIRGLDPEYEACIRDNLNRVLAKADKKGLRAKFEAALARR